MSTLYNRKIGKPSTFQRYAPIPSGPTTRNSPTQPFSGGESVFLFFILTRVYDQKVKYKCVKITNIANGKIKERNELHNRTRETHEHTLKEY